MKNVIHIQPVVTQSPQNRNDLLIKINGDKTVRRGVNRASGTTISLKFYKDYSINKLRTGLDKLVDNPWYNTDELLKEDYAKYRHKEKITLQEKLEIETGVSIGTYTSECVTPNMVAFNSQSRGIVPKQPNTLETFTYYFSGTESTIIPYDTPRNKLAYHMVLTHPKVAQLGETVNPDKHVLRIVSAEEETAFKLKSRNVLQQAYANLNILQTTGKGYERARFALLLGVTLDVEPDLNTIDNGLSDYVWLETKDKFGTQAERVDFFNNWFNMWKDKNVEFYMNSLVKLAETSRVFVKSVGEYYWTSKKGTVLYNLGSSVDRIVSKLIIAYDEAGPEIEGNIYNMLVDELKTKGINIDQ